VSGGFFRSTSIVGAFTLISRVTGLLRDMVFSRMFGAGVLMDAVKAGVTVRARRRMEGRPTSTLSVATELVTERAPERTTTL
jgi:hypothetical protein